MREIFTDPRKPFFLHRRFKVAAMNGKMYQDAILASKKQTSAIKMRIKMDFNPRMRNSTTPPFMFLSSQTCIQSREQKEGPTTQPCLLLRVKIKSSFWMVVISC